jgi:hypothetical protein
MSSLTLCSQNEHLMKYFCMYFATLFLHSHSHHNLWKWLEISPVTMVYVIYITNLGMVDGIKWGVKDHQQAPPHRTFARPE